MVQTTAAISKSLVLRQIPEGTFNSIWLHKFVKAITSVGEKRKSEIAIHFAFKKLKLLYGISPSIAFLTLLTNYQILFETKLRRKSRSFFNVPILVFGLRKITLTTQMLVKAIKAKKDLNYTSSVYDELVDSIIYDKGGFLKSRAKLQTTLVENRMYRRFR
jgi:ribosomal protein S7